VLSVPIIALTVRELPADSVSTEGNETGEDEPADQEGVFLVVDGTASFVPVEIGIAGQEYFEVLSGLSESDTVVAGPYVRIRQLQDGDAVRAADPAGASSDEG
jgi:HlyD family secretion protein